jgi:poly-beta-1,6-N-acetyl-D-glucosamine synthase
MKHYIAITPARDEERHIGRLILSMLEQTRLPGRWIIIDDGSTDQTAEIIDRAAARHPWIEPHHLPANRSRAPGGESVIMRFLPRDAWEGYDAILRLDADLSFLPHFAYQLLAEMDKDPRLGIAGPVLLERRPSDSRWREVRAPSFHTRGAAKMYSTKCFAAIGGLEAALGWDTIDEARAMMLGFHTRSFRHIAAYHHRPQGAAGGLWRSRKAAGHAAYNAGYAPLFLMARAARLALKWPPLVSGLALTAGYLECWKDRSERAASPALVKFVRRQQMRRLLMMESLWR